MEVQSSAVNAILCGKNMVANSERQKIRQNKLQCSSIFLILETNIVMFLINNCGGVVVRGMITCANVIILANDLTLIG